MGMQESKNFCGVYLPKLWMELDWIWHAVKASGSGEWFNYFISLDQYSKEKIQLRLYCKRQTTNKQANKPLTLVASGHWPISFKLDVVIDITKLYGAMPVWITLTSNEGHSFMRKLEFLHSFSRKFSINLDQMWYVATTCWSVLVQGKFYIQGRDHVSVMCICIYLYKYMFKIGWRLDTNQVTSFTCGIMTDMTRFYMMMPVWMTLTFTQGHRVARKLKLV